MIYLQFNNLVKWVLFADDTSLVISSVNNMQYRNEVSTSFAHLNDWFNPNLLTLHFNKTKLVQFMAKPSSNSETSVRYHNNVILSSADVKFLGIIVESSCTLKAHISQLLPKLIKTCYLMRVIKAIMPIDTQKVVSYSYFHYLLTYGIIFGGNSSFSMHIFRIQKRIIRVISGLRPRDSCRDAFKDWGILPL
jgi:hypothetical protein